MLKKSIVLFMLLLFCTGASANDIFNVDCSFGWDGCYRPMQWTTVNVAISSSLTEPFQGVLSVSAQQDGLNNLIILNRLILFRKNLTGATGVQVLMYRLQNR